MSEENESVQYWIEHWPDDTNPWHVYDQERSDSLGIYCICECEYEEDAKFLWN